MNSNSISDRLDLLIGMMKGKVDGGFFPVLDAKKIIREQDAALRTALAYLERVGCDGEGGTHEYEVALDAVQTAIRNCAGT